MTNPDCEICFGRGIIRLPRFTKASVSPSTGPSKQDYDSTLSPLNTNYKDFPCPECSPKVSEDSVIVFEAEVFMDVAITKLSGEASMAATTQARRYLVDILVDQFLRGGFIQFDVGKADKFQLRTPMRARLGVVTTKVVESLEDRVNQRARVLADAVADRAKWEIDNWNSRSRYNAQIVGKEDAKRLVGEALREVLKDRTGRYKGKA
jgi:hypothetical protein